VNQALVSLVELLEGITDGISQTTNSDGFEHTRITELGLKLFRVEVVGLLLHVRLDATNEEGVGGCHEVHERLEGLLEEPTAGDLVRG